MSSRDPAAVWGLSEFCILNLFTLSGHPNKRSRVCPTRQRLDTRSRAGNPASIRCGRAATLFEHCEEENELYLVIKSCFWQQAGEARKSVRNNNEPLKIAYLIVSDKF
ncbi:hypothetical protein H920_14158 [Fukomys damarensis]|uniref:Uncharacterized protein n=1 Tax=Fukomys damarensis TaxID=885580 RepID=A0A091D0D9_FUKDA|nr:hypothetical protein H920_14158 [Fukomys damarensis]